MKNLKIHSELISLEEQLEILEDARALLIEEVDNGYSWGLCCTIRDCLPTRFDESYKLQLLIPLFTQGNAIKYHKGIGISYWWPRFTSDDKPNLAPRLAMLDWMIGLIKEEINKQK